MGRDGWPQIAPMRSAPPNVNPAAIPVSFTIDTHARITPRVRLVSGLAPHILALLPATLPESTTMKRYSTRRQFLSQAGLAGADSPPRP